MQYSTIPYSIVQYKIYQTTGIVQYSTIYTRPQAQYRSVQCNTVQYFTVQGILDQKYNTVAVKYKIYQTTGTVQHSTRYTRQQVQYRTVQGIPDNR